MPESAFLSRTPSQLADHPNVAPPLRSALTQALTPDWVEQAASYGRWWHDAETAQLVLSAGAAVMLGVAVGWHRTLGSCFAHLLADDVSTLTSALTEASVTGKQIERDFCIINADHGLHWLRLMSLPQTLAPQTVTSGVLLNITSSRHAAMRERLSFESTRFLVNTDTLGDAVTKVIQLVCENLGWEWGAYWALEPDPTGARQLVCKHFWHGPQDSLKAFTTESCIIRMIPGAGLVGQVWQTGVARWIEDLVSDQDFLRYKSARQCPLRSGYVFPVVYVTDDGHRHSPGVLEFYSSLSRQREAQLPNLSVTIGALIAQTAQRLEQQETIRQLAQTDELTELANRSHFYRMLNDTCLAASASNASFGLMFIDLDRFKPINDSFGHEAGNVVLRTFAHRLQTLVPARSHVGRLGGDEFAILLIPDGAMRPLPEQLAALAEHVLQAARMPFLFEGREMTVSSSIGISVFPEDGTTGPELLRSADAAMYSIKKNGRNALSFFGCHCGSEPKTTD